MNMQIFIGETLRVHLELISLGAHITHRRPGALLHHVAQLAGEIELALARHGAGLDEQYVSAKGGPGQTGGHAGHRGPELGVRGDALRPQDARYVLGADGHAFGLALGHPAGRIAAQGANLPFQVPQTRLTGVGLDQKLDGRILYLELLGVQAVLLALARHQVALGDLELVLGRIAGNLDNLHAVP